MVKNNKKWTNIDQMRVVVFAHDNGLSKSEIKNLNRQLYGVDTNITQIQHLIWEDRIPAIFACPKEWRKNGKSK